MANSEQDFGKAPRAGRADQSPQAIVMVGVREYGERYAVELEMRCTMSEAVRCLVERAR